jgi:hypothetical protein
VKYSQKRYCRNCYYPLPYKAKFCSHCGQKDTDGRVGLGELMHQLWFKAFHLESRYLRILWHLFVPGKVSEAYFQGKQKRYPPPVQFFFVIMFFFLFLFSRQFSTDAIKVGRPQDHDAVIHVDDWSEPQAVSLSRLFREFQLQQQHRAAAHRLQLRFDSLPDVLRTDDARRAVDSLVQAELRGTTPLGDSISLAFFGKQHRVATDDIFTRDPEDVLDLYSITGSWDRIVMRQAIKFMLDPNAMFNAYLGNFAWTIMALVSIMAFMLSLLYRRQQRYYVEHFVFLLHQHSSLFWLLAIALLLERAGFMTPGRWMIVGAWGVVSPFLAMWRYYRQHVLRTFLKWTAFSVVYGLSFVVFFGLGIFVVFLIF